MYRIKRTTQFDRSLKKFLKKRKLTLQELARVIDMLAKNKKLSKKYKNHKLKDIWECHLQADILLLYYIIDKRDVLILYDLRKHDELNRG